MRKSAAKWMHVVLWAMFVLVTYSSAGRVTRITQDELGQSISMVYYQPFTLIIVLIDVLCKALFFYGHVFLLRKRFPPQSTKNKYYFWLTALFVLTLVLSGLGQMLAIQFPGNEEVQDLSLSYLYPYSLLFHSFLLLLSFGYISILEMRREDLLKEELKQESLLTELKYLKSQINPHFLFNTLNNIYGIVRKNDDPKGAQSIAKLARLMRYMIYESNTPTVGFEMEIDYLRDFVDLNKMRIHNPESIDFRIDIEDSPSPAIAPMLLLPFVENAFKHGAGSNKIKIHLHLKEGQLDLQVENENNPKTATDGNQGLGLENVKRRLELLYPNKHRLRVNAADIYSVKLQLDLS